MISIVETTELKVEPDEVWRFLGNLHRGVLYQQWHPRDHRYYKQIRHEPNAVGSVFRFSEVIGGRRLTLTCRVIRVLPQRLVVYSAAFPLSLLRAGSGSFNLRPTSDGVDFVATVEYGYRTPILGGLVDRLTRLWINPESLRQHMRDEGANLAVALRQAANSGLDGKANC